MGLDKKHEVCFINHVIRKTELKFAELDLMLNTSKTETLLISKKHDKEDLRSALERDLPMSGKNLEVKDNIKYLGIILDETSVPKL